MLPELCQQDYPSHRVVFIDDASDDATQTITAEMAKRFDNLLVVRNETAPPAGWVGKCWAVYQGYRALRQYEAREDLPPARWVCFTDADIHWDARCLRRAMDHARETDADVVGLLPMLTFGSVSETVVQLQLALALGILFPMDKAMDPAHPDTLTGGAFTLVRRSLYDQIGGHEAVKGEVVEDINLGRRLKAAGGKVAVAMAPELMWCRMYDGPADMWEGLTKNAFAGMEYSWARLVGMSLAVMLANVLPPVYVVISAAWLAVSPGWASGVALGLSLAIVALTAGVLGTLAKALQVSRGYAWSMSIGSAMYLAIIAGSVWHYCRGGNHWKGRRYARPTPSDG